MSGWQTVYSCNNRPCICLEMAALRRMMECLREDHDDVIWSLEPRRLVATMPSGFRVDWALADWAHADADVCHIRAIESILA